MGASANKWWITENALDWKVVLFKFYYKRMQRLFSLQDEADAFLDLALSLSLF